MEKETNKKDKDKDNTLPSKCHHIHCDGYSGKSLFLGVCHLEDYPGQPWILAYYRWNCQTTHQTTEE
eukprot:15338427-Ditylum_brightwellii.AAC.1